MCQANPVGKFFLTRTMRLRNKEVFEEKAREHDNRFDRRSGIHTEAGFHSIAARIIQMMQMKETTSVSTS